jgi:hypothetical protein
MHGSRLALKRSRAEDSGFALPAKPELKVKNFIIIMSSDLQQYKVRTCKY